jgi:hypothetical protein
MSFQNTINHMRQLYKIFHTILLFISFIFGGSYSLNAQTTVPFTASGTWVCPAGVTTITFEAYGAGGGGGGGGASNKYGGGGGGGGGYAIHNSVSVTPGVSYTITIGTEGAAGAAGANGTGGSASSGVFGALTITANGGSGGSGYASASNSGGNGGTGVNGTTNRTGGTGGTGTNSGSGGGGGAAGSTGAGSAGAMPTGGAGGGGSAGDGGDGSTSNSNSGNPGVNYGGGGSGGTKSVSGSAGAPGYALITYATPPPPGSTCASAVSLPCATSSLAGTTVGTTNVAHGTPCSLSNYGVWYTFVGDGQSTTISTTSTMDLEMAVMSGSCGSFTNISCNDAATGAETATFTAVSGTTYYIYIAHYSTTGSTTGAFTISRTCCIPPTTSNAGTDITLGNCVTTATLAGNTPTVGTGTWTCQSGCTGLTITDPNSPTTTVTGFTSGTSTFRWRIINGACTPSNDQVDVIAACPPANNTCATATNLPCGTTDLAGTTAGTSNLAHGTSCSMSNYGVWYSFVGDGQMTTITVVPSGGFDPEMSISSSPTSCGTLTSIACKDVSGTETHTFTTVSGVYYYIYIAYYTSGTTTGAFTISRTCCTAPTIANAGADIITSCTTTATLAGNTATVGTGAWTVVSGPGSVTTPSSPTSGVTGLTSGTTTVFRWTISNACSTSNDNVSVTNLCGGPANQICSAATDLPCGTTNLAGTTNGTSSITNNQSCSMSTYGVWYTFIGDGNTTVITVVPSGGYDPEMSISSSPSSCGTLTSIACKDATGNEEHVFATVAGVYYYVYISYYTTGTTTGNFTISRQCLSCPSGLGSGNVNIASLPYSAAGQTTTGAGDDLTSTNLPTCGSTSYSTGEDKVYIFTPASSGNVTVTLNSGSPGASIKLYQGCPFAGICVAYDEDYTDGVKTFCSSLTAGTTYYLVVDSYDLYSDDLASFTLDITVPTAGAVNELPCNATTIFNGTAAAGNNECTNALSEPATKPSCWGSGPINSVWYKFQATSTSMYLQTTLTTISSTQIAVYTGTCGSLSATPAFCNQDAPPSGCSGSTSRNSVLDMTTLTVGAWYWVRVDGEDDAQGSFNIILNDGTAATTDDPILGQDCGSPVPICTNTVTVPNPSYAGTGNVCDFTVTKN